MTLLVLSFLGGVLTILSPCILPILPFVFARADRPFLTSGLPMLLGMATTFAGVAALAAVSGAWVVQANQAGRWIALVLFAVFGLMLLAPAFATRAAEPLVRLGNRLSRSADAVEKKGGGVAASLLLGVATGLLWAPCAGPILGLLLTTAAINGVSVETTFLLFAFALGAATSLAVALFAGGRVFAALKKSLGAGEWLRRGLGVAVLCGVAAIALGLDTGLLTRLSAGGAQNIEAALMERVQPGPSGAMTGEDVLLPPDEGGAMMRADDTNAMMRAATPGGGPRIEGPFPSLAGGVSWLNSPPLTPEQLRGKVVLIDFWTYSCINCLRALPYVRGWAEKYRDHGLVVIGVHAPEFAFERDAGNVRRAVRKLEVTYPVVLDNNLAIWRAFGNQYWPAHYFIDAEGQIRHHHFGEGDYDRSEQVIQQLLREAGVTDIPDGVIDPRATGVAAPAASARALSPETYVGYARRESFVSPQAATDALATFTTPTALSLNQWGLTGAWTVSAEHARLHDTGGTIRFRFRARDLHLVLGAGDGPVRFRVTIDGKPPGVARGMDIDAAGAGVVREQRLYQLVRGGGGADRTFEIEFLDPGVEAFAFTFG